MNIGRFFYSTRPPGEAVVVDLLASSDGPLRGSVKMPTGAAARLQILGHPYVTEAMEIPYALGYAVTVAVLMGLSLFISGDVLGWESEWGQLIEADIDDGNAAGSPLPVFPN